MAKERGLGLRLELAARRRCTHSPHFRRSRAVRDGGEPPLTEHPFFPGGVGLSLHLGVVYPQVKDLLGENQDKVLEICSHAATSLRFTISPSSPFPGTCSPRGSGTWHE